MNSGNMLWKLTNIHGLVHINYEFLWEYCIHYIPPDFVTIKTQLYPAIYMSLSCENICKWLRKVKQLWLRYGLCVDK